MFLLMMTTSKLQSVRNRQSSQCIHCMIFQNLLPTSLSYTKTKTTGSGTVLFALLNKGEFDYTEEVRLKIGGDAEVVGAWAT